MPYSDQLDCGGVDFAVAVVAVFILVGGLELIQRPQETSRFDHDMIPVVYGNQHIVARTDGGNADNIFCYDLFSVV
jgi:hypothetical protein